MAKTRPAPDSGLDEIKLWVVWLRQAQLETIAANNLASDERAARVTEAHALADAVSAKMREDYAARWRRPR